MEKPMISVSDLDVHFGRFHVLKNVSLAVSEGESYGLVGESGSGKSTLLRVLTGLVAKQSGQIEIAGKSMFTWRDKAFCRDLQMVFQDPYGSIHPRHSVDRILSEPLRIHRFADLDKRVNQTLDDVGLGSAFRFRFPHQLSGGQRQRVAIARAIITEPRILLLDEPTSALDVSVQSEILNLLQRLRRERNLTYILVSHNLAVVSHMCSRLAVMNQGEIVEEMSANALHVGQAHDLYTQALIAASKGYQPALSEVA